MTWLLKASYSSCAEKVAGGVTDIYGPSYYLLLCLPVLC